MEYVVVAVLALVVVVLGLATLAAESYAIASFFRAITRLFRRRRPPVGPGEDHRRREGG